MPSTGPRPHTWKVQGELNHAQYVVWLQMKSQAQFRDEIFRLSFEDFQRIWQDKWHLKGRSKGTYCLTRVDPQGAWEPDNVVCVRREDHLRRQGLFKRQRTKHGKNDQICT